MHDGGSVVGASVTCRDLTELKHAAQYARSLLEATLDPMVTISPEGKINDVNEAAAMITGISRHKLIGTDFSQYFAEPDKAHECYQRAFEQGSITDSPLTMCHRDGSLTEVSYNASIYRDPSGKVLGVLATARDMTWQKKAFEAAQRIAAIVENSEEAIVDHSLDGIITSWNPAATRMCGYSRSMDPLVTISAEGKITDVNEATVGARSPVGWPTSSSTQTSLSRYGDEAARRRRAQSVPPCWAFRPRSSRVPARLAGTTYGRCRRHEQLAVLGCSRAHEWHCAPGRCGRWGASSVSTWLLWW